MSVAVGCSDDSTKSTGQYVESSVSGDTTVSQPSVNESDFPDNYVDLEQQVYKVIATQKTTKDSVTTGCNFMKMVAENKDNFTDEVKEKMKNEIVDAVTQQVEGVTCNDAQITVSQTDSDMAYLTVTFTYDETNAQDSKIYNIPV
jgi:hypothetical protein